MNRYLKIWLKQAALSLETTFENRLAAGFFMFGKLLRFILFIGFLYLVHRQVSAIAGYTLEQMIIVYLVFTLLDMFGQTFFRGIYWFREQIVSGELDFKLIKPMHPLFLALTRQVDFLDIPLFILILVFLFMQNLTLSLIGWLMVLILILSSLLIITAVHILVAASGILTTEVDHTIMIFRDLSNMARFPIDIYTPFVRNLLTFVIPIALAFTVPAKALLGILSWQFVLITPVIAILVFALSIYAWNEAIKRYSSASS